MTRTNDRINARFLLPLVEHYYRLRVTNRLHGFPYERCAELPYVLEQLEPRFQERLRYLDIGSGGASPLPTWLLANTSWDITCVDKARWVRQQLAYAARVASGEDARRRFHVIERGLVEADLPARSFDVITSISVIEHLEGTSDVEAMAASGALLREGGTYLLSTPVNEGHYREIYVARDVYGERFHGERAVFYQRHHDTASLRSRLVEASGLVEIERTYFGDYDDQFFESLGGSRLHQLLNLGKRLNIPRHALRHLTYSDRPVSRADMKDNTASGVIIVLTRGPGRPAGAR